MERGRMGSDVGVKLGQDAAAVVQTAKTSLRDILDESGTILYSSSETLVPGKYYFLGLNPGGSVENTRTIRESLDQLCSSRLNAYLDEDWSSDSRSHGEAGHPLQKGFKFLFHKLGVEPHTVCASNLIFKRSADERDAGYPRLAELCWPVHRTILEVVQPGAIITFGRQPFDFIRRKLGGIPPQKHPSGHGTWPWRYSVSARGEKLVGLPHMSIYALWCHPEVVDSIKYLVG